VNYRVVLERDESGAWIARVPSVPGCHTYGRTIDQARRRIREALSLWIEDPHDAKLVEDIRLPVRAKEALQRSTRARADAERHRQSAHAATARTARVLVEDLHLSLRDAGELLGLSYQRVLQLVRQPGLRAPR
jgi:predicted RNase H-like HicB family nuclease